MDTNMKRKRLAAKKHKIVEEKSKKNLCSSVFICGLIFLCLAGFIFYFNSDSLQKVSAEESPDALESALYERQEFFGAQATVPLPTARALENLEKLAANE